MPIEPRDEHDAQPTASPFKPQLVAANDLEEAIATMLRMFGAYVTEPLLAEYLDVLKQEPASFVWQAVKDWIRHPLENRSARAHELAQQARALRAKTSEPTPVWQFELPTTPPKDLDAIFADLARQYPDNAFLKARIGERARAKAAGHELNGQQEIDAIFGTNGAIAGQLNTLPHGRTEDDDA